MGAAVRLLCVCAASIALEAACAVAPNERAPAKGVVPAAAPAIDAPPRPSAIDAVEPPARTESPPPPAPTTPALSGDAPLVALDVAGFGAAVVALPLGARERRPVLVATHGNYDRPEWQCATWAPIVAAHAFVLCPRGIARRDSPSASDPRWEYGTNRTLEAEITAGLEALRVRFPEHVDAGPAVYAGFSQGAIMGVAIALRAPKAFPRMVLTEGGFDNWTAQSAAAYARGGGARVLFACGQPGCSVSAKQTVSLLTRAGVEARVVAAPGSGHSYGGAVADAIGESLSWLVAGDARWGSSPATVAPLPPATVAPFTSADAKPARSRAVSCRLSA